MKILQKIFGDENKHALKKAQKVVDKVNAFESEISKLSNEQLKAKTAEFKERLSKGETLDDIMPEAFATVREASKRTLNQRHYDVQIIGGAVLHQGDIAEMRTGEGKTLVATLPAYLNALTGEGVHVVTVNDYLSRRDAVWMGQIYSFLGLSVGVLNHEASFLYTPTEQGSELDTIRDEEGSFKVEETLLTPVSRKEAYQADIVYGTNQEFGFDYLRDNLSYSSQEIRQRGHNFAIVDEVDSILIDEARTPLIISAPSSEAEDLYIKFADIARHLKEGEDYTVDEKQRAIQLTDAGITKAEKLLGVENIYTDKGIKYVHHLETAVRAKALFKRDTHYLIKDGEVVIIDEFTGRMQPGRRWSEGLHQAIEAKEGVKIQQESKTFASITYQNYFRMYKKLAGMTGTAVSSSEEFYKVYGLNTVAIPTNKPVRRIDHEDLIFQTEKGKFTALARKVKELHKKGQPVLLGTISVEKNEVLSAYLKQAGVPHQILNAKNHEKEGEIIAQAGRKGAVTVATNMAGRGVDIKLGGATATEQEAQEVRELGGLFVIGTERHEARRIDDQLRGRAGRQGDPGETQFYVSLEDDLMRVFAGDTIKSMMGKFGIPEDEPIYNKMITRALESAQKKIEGFHFDARKQVLAYDDVLNKQRLSIYAKRMKILTGDEKTLDSTLDEMFKDDKETLELIKQKKEELQDEFYNQLKILFLQTIDLLWVSHLETMEYLRSSVNLRAYGQRDPLVEYKKEGLRLYKELQENLKTKIKYLIPHLSASKKQQENTIEIKPSAKIGRNDPCPCGSGKKYKKCCMPS